MKRINLFMFSIILLFLIAIVFSCKTDPVESLSPEPVPVLAAVPQVEGVVTDTKTGAPIQGVSLSLGSISITSDANGTFKFDSDLTAGTANLTVQKTGYISFIEKINVPAKGSSVYAALSLAPTAPAVTITSASGGQATATDKDGTSAADIPAGAVSTNTQVSITPYLGSGAAIADKSKISSNAAPAQAVALEPYGTQFSKPVQIAQPLTMPTNFITGPIIVRDAETGAQIGTATVENGKFVYNVSRGGKYLVEVPTQLKHNIVSSKEAIMVGSLGANDKPGTFKTLPFNVTNTVEVAEGFSENLIHTIFEIEPSSRQYTASLSKEAGVSIVASYAALAKETHTYSALGKVVAKSLANNQGSASTFEGNYQAKWSSSTAHGTYKFLGWWSPLNNRYLTTAEINNLGLPNPPPLP